MAKKPKRHVPFIEDACGADETLLLTARLHWICLAKGVAAFMAFAWGGRTFDTYSEKFMAWLLNANMDAGAFAVYKIGDYVEKGCVTAGLLIFLMYVLSYLTTTVGLTTKRLMLRTGVIFVKLNNVDLEEFKGEYVDHKLLGRFLNYGEIHMDARFVSNFFVPAIADPYRLIRALNEARAAGGDSVVAGEVPLREAPLQPVTTTVPALSHGYVPVENPAIVAATQEVIAPVLRAEKPVLTMRAGDLPPDMPVAVTGAQTMPRPRTRVVLDGIKPDRKNSAHDAFSAKS